MRTEKSIQTPDEPSRAQEQTGPKKGELKTEVLSTAPIEDVKLDVPASRDVGAVVAAPIVADATARNAERREEAPEVVYAVVIEEKTVFDAHCQGRVKLHAGKVISSKDYDLPALARQGLKMRKAAKPEPGKIDDAIFVG